MYVPDFINCKSALRAFTDLWDDLDWIRHPDAPRGEYWTNDFNQDYTYGRGAGIRTYKSQPVHYWIDFVSQVLNQDYCYFNACFLNRYENNRDWLGWHSDDDPSIDHSKPIAIVTLYSNHEMKPRSIQFREILKDSYGPVTDQVLEHGSLCIMPPGSQFTHQHRVPKAGFECPERISLTFRSLFKS